MKPVEINDSFAVSIPLNQWQTFHNSVSICDAVPFLSKCFKRRQIHCFQVTIANNRQSGH